MKIGLPTISASRTIEKSGAKNGSGFDTFRHGSPNFKHPNMLLEESKNNDQDVFSSPLFMHKSVLGSIKDSLKKLNLIQGDPNNVVSETRRSSPEKLSPSKFSAKLLPENKVSEDRSFRLRNLENQERQDSEMPLNEEEEEPRP